MRIGRCRVPNPPNYQESVDELKIAAIVVGVLLLNIVVFVSWLNGG